MYDVLYDVRPLQTASRLRGIGTVTRQLIEALSRVDRENRYLLLRWSRRPSPELALAPDFAHRWLEVSRCPQRHLGWLWDRVLLAFALSRRAEVGHFLSPFDLEMGWPSWGVIGGMRQLVMAYDTHPLSGSRDVLQGKHRLLAPLFAWMGGQLRAAAALTCISHTTADDVHAHAGVPRERLHVTPLAVDARFTVRHQPEIDRFCARAELQRPYLLYVGGANPNKNLPGFLEAIARTDVPHVVLAVPSSARGELEARAGALGISGRLTFLSGVSDEDLPLLYAGARQVALPSLQEGFGLPVLEAMASGAPVVCSDIPALHEVGADAAAYFPPRDVALMARVIGGVWGDADRRAAMRAAGLVRAGAFTWDACAHKVMEVYRSSC
ncbi:MAG: glycosyltransferase family 4 protein [Actinobacteria bacterium]|nr:glycosyltransferase family 4 protein [Actinomycetota bacterium]